MKTRVCDNPSTFLNSCSYRIFWTRSRRRHFFPTGGYTHFPTGNNWKKGAQKERLCDTTRTSQLHSIPFQFTHSSWVVKTGTLLPQQPWFDCIVIPFFSPVQLPTVQSGQKVPEPHFLTSGTAKLCKIFYLVRTNKGVQDLRVQKKDWIISLHLPASF